MNLFSESLTNIYIMTNNLIGLGRFNHLQYTFGITNLGQILFAMIIYNLIVRPSRYRFRLFWAPDHMQWLIRQVLFFFIITNGIAFALTIAIPIILFMIYLVTFSSMSFNHDGSGPFSSMLGD